VLYGVTLTSTELFISLFRFFQDGLKTLNHFQVFVEGLKTQLAKIRQRQEHERKQLIELREALKGSMTSYKEVGELDF
jgi:Arf-GAP/SH3 domain/ANK repeat/PH domain-containing protein